MDRIWAESQLDLLRWRAGNTTNFSTVSASAQAEMGSTKVEAASNEQLLPFLIVEPPKRRILVASACFFRKCRRMYVQIKGRTCAYYIHSSSRSLPVSDAQRWNTHCSHVMKCA